MDEKLKKAGIIVVGSEILKGHVKDTNSTFMCKRFHDIGVKVSRITAVVDEINEIAEEVARFSAKFDIVITTGGLIHEDITYEAIARALNDKIVPHQYMTEAIRSRSEGKSDAKQNPVGIPERARLLYVVPKQGKEVRHNGLQEGKLPSKKVFPVVCLKNVYVLPGSLEWTEHAFDHLEKIFENPYANLYAMMLFLRVTELKVLKELNDAVTKYENRVSFGSCSCHSNDKEFVTKIFLESNTVDDVTSAYAYLKSNLPENVMNNELGAKDAELVRELTSGNTSLSRVVKNSLKVIETALDKYKVNKVYLSFNGGKDCTVLLHLVWAVWKNFAPSDRINSIYIKTDVVFPEVDAFVNRISERYDMNVIVMHGNIKEALVELHRSNRDLKAIFMGTRRGDPHAENLNEFQMCDKGWPPLMRVNPILDWSYEDVWNFLRILNLPYCRLYDEGYTSIGNIKNTLPNPALKIPGAGDKFYPAYRLADASLERQGRR